MFEAVTKFAATPAGNAANLTWFALVDSAQNPALPGALRSAHSAQARCLLGAEQGSPLAVKAPHLVLMPAPSEHDVAWRWVIRHGPQCPCVSIIAATVDAASLFDHLVRFTEVVLPDQSDLCFAFWDPAILGTLVGHSDDTTLHVPGPVLSDEQRAALLAPMAAWWYWDREGHLHAIHGTGEPATPTALPLQLSQEQVDSLVEASVPDHILHFIELNQRHLLHGLDGTQRYSAIRKHLAEAKELGLDGMADLVNFACASLIYQERMQTDPEVKALLVKVKQGELTFESAMEQFP